MQYEVITYDVWGNTREGYEVNQPFHTGRFIEVAEDTSDAAINRRLGAVGFVNNTGIAWDGEPEYSLYGTYKRNGRPAFELRRVDEQE